MMGMPTDELKITGVQHRLGSKSCLQTARLAKTGALQSVRGGHSYNLASNKLKNGALHTVQKPLLQDHGDKPPGRGVGTCDRKLSTGNERRGDRRDLAVARVHRQRQPPDCWLPGMCAFASPLKPDQSLRPGIAPLLQLVSSNEWAGQYTYLIDAKMRWSFMAFSGHFDVQ